MLEASLGSELRGDDHGVLICFMCVTPELASVPQGAVEIVVPNTIKMNIKSMKLDGQWKC